MIALSMQHIIKNYFIVMKELMCVSFLFLLVLPVNAITPTGFLLHEHTLTCACHSFQAAQQNTCPAIKFLKKPSPSRQLPLFIVCRYVCERFF